jgi:hypothetical protein
MKNTKTFELLRALTEPELKEFTLLFNQNSASKDAHKLLILISGYRSKRMSDKVTKEDLYRRLFPKLPYNDQKMRHLLFLIAKATDEYLVNKHLEKTDFQKELILLESYRKRKLNKLFEQQYKDMRKMLETGERRDTEYFYTTFKLDEAFNKYIKAKQKRSLEPNIQNLSDNLDKYYLLQKLQIMSEAMNYKNIININYNIHFSAEVEKAMSSKLYKSESSLNIAWSALQSLLDPENPKHYEEMKEALPRLKNQLEEESLADYNTLARNYCIKQINKGKNHYLRDLFELYQLDLEVQNKSGQVEMAPGTYKNIVSTAFSLNEYEWAFHFIKDYTPLLPEDMQQSYYHFNIARYYFHQKNYQVVNHHLLQVDYPEHFLMLSAKALLLKTYFELDEYNAMDSLVSSFKELLRSKEILGYHRKNYSNYVKYLVKIYKLEKGDKAAKAKILEELKDTSEIIDKSWLLAKLELKK